LCGRAGVARARHEPAPAPALNSADGKSWPSIFDSQAVGRLKHEGAADYCALVGSELLSDDRVEPQIGENTMSDDLTNKGPQDRSRISLLEPHEVQYWADKFGVSKERLSEAVRNVGHSTAAVERELKRLA
jgi:Protein of unknown function (DUF3606)